MNTNIWCADLGNGFYRNPILYADYSDPDAIRVGDDYFMIASSFCNTPGVPLLHSKDLVNWKVVNYIWQNVPEERYAKPIHGCGAWAPAIRYHDGVYYAFIPMPDEGIYVSKTTDPFGVWDEPFNLRPGAGWIDPCPFWDEDGRAYMVAGVAKSRIGYKSVLHIVEMKPDASALIGEEIKVFDGNENNQETIEGPKLYKRNGWYYIFAPAGGVKVGWQTVLRSRNIYGPYEYKVVMRQGETKINGPHQGAWVTTQTGEDWFLHFQDVYAAGRITHLQPMTWLDNDWPIIGIQVPDCEYGEPVYEYAKPDVGCSYPPCEPAAADDFMSDKLGLQWQWNANEGNNWYSVGNGKLKLNCIANDNPMLLSELPNLLIQKWPAPEFTCQVKMNFSNIGEGDYAGLVNMGMLYSGLMVTKKDSHFALLAVSGEQKFSGTEWSTTELSNELLTTVDCESITLRYTVQCIGQRDINKKETNFPYEKVTLSYSINGERFVDAITVDAKPGRWVGTKMGMFAASANADSTAYAEFENFDFI